MEENLSSFQKGCLCTGVSAVRHSLLMCVLLVLSFKIFLCESFWFYCCPCYILFLQIKRCCTTNVVFVWHGVSLAFTLTFFPPPLDHILSSHAVSPPPLNNPIFNLHCHWSCSSLLTSQYHLFHFDLAIAIQLCVCVRERDREVEKFTIVGWQKLQTVCVCVCVCVWVRETTQTIYTW